MHRECRYAIAFAIQMATWKKKFFGVAYFKTVFFDSVGLAEKLPGQ
jgi:hypothetical protein